MMMFIPDKPSHTAAFDSLAATYDQDFTQSPIARYLRDSVQGRLLHHFGAGQHLLEMGCGTGQDALALAQQGIFVTATDASPAMLAAAREKTHQHPHIKIMPLDLNILPTENPDLNHRFDGVFANFGVLNCLAEWQGLARWLAQRVKTGGVVGFAIMPPFCVWEMAWHGAHGDFKTAFRRWRGSTFQPDMHAAPLRITYPTIQRITHDFAPYFDMISVRPLGLFLPPSDIYGIIEKRPRFFAFLRRLEQSAAQRGVLALFADHYWIELRRHSCNSTLFG